MTSILVRDTSLVISGITVPPTKAELVGARARVLGTIHEVDGTTELVFALTQSRWGGSVLPLPAGEYRIETDADLDSVTLAETNATVMRVQVAGGVVTISAPIDPVYRSADGQGSLERRYTASGEKLENAVFFESFYGRNASCNPLALDREIARRLPNVTRYWSVVDLSVDVPGGAIAVVEGSPEWWRARGESRLLIVNDWLRRAFARHPGQKVLQTWHGTPLKRLALHRPGFDPRRMVAVIRESRRWDGLLAQNAYAAKILKAAYRFRGALWTEGYPRNDVLVAGNRNEVRDILGIEPTERVLLYAPTWRDDRTEMVDFLDLDALAHAADAVVLVRGHSRTLLPGRDTAGPRVIDVTSFPDTSRLILAADELITDYSSVMFDFSVTGKPMSFLVPDIEHYRGALRGFYFDLVAHAPGPVVSSQSDLHMALANPERETLFAERYATWRKRFNSRDDGRASERVVARLIDQNWLATD
ncbi:CDP-glycerol glycerophosphotransferase family protein [Microbacterium sp. YY-03]|uniref:CDP-glycerol glycerophosphotransferase family protein n=1 Tax=Microbacterium sp. YY-03 TaxID=3421636 RepID=UPI003D16E7F1